MKKITLFIALLSMSVLSAQQTFEIDWKIAATNTTITIEQGDTVKWIWGDSAQHDVASISGSQETFDSGLMTGQGIEFSYTFTQVGDNPYECTIHPGNMNGVITVEQTMSVTDKFVKNLKFFPNPVKNDLTISSLFKVDNYQIYNVLGTLVKEGKGTGNITQVDMSRLNSGLYFVKIISNNLQSTLKIAKK